jgi:hypothetical protein
VLERRFGESSRAESAKHRRDVSAADLPDSEITERGFDVQPPVVAIESDALFGASSCGRERLDQRASARADRRSSLSERRSAFAPRSPRPRR